MDESSFKYEVAFSFLTQDEALASELNDLVQDRLSTFLYSQQQAKLAGGDGEQLFNRVFREEARLVVVLYREAWGSTNWTRIEETAIRGRAHEEGYDFTLFIPLDSPTTVPKWLPKAQLWFNLERFGTRAAASIIEERVRVLGGEPRPETVQDRAARLARAMAFAERRKKFRGSEEGVGAANRAFDKLETALREAAEDIKSKTTSVAFSVYRIDKRRIVVRGVRLGLMVDWEYRFGNSLDDSRLCARILNRPPALPNEFAFEKPQQLHSFTFNFDMTPSEAHVWVASGDKRQLHAEELVSFVLHKFMDEEQKALSRSNT